MAKLIDRSLEIMRQMIGETDTSNPQATDAKLLIYLNEFIRLHSPNNTAFIQDKTFYTSNTSANDDTEAWPEDQYIIPHDPIYFNGIRGKLYTDPDLFYSKWPKDVTFESGLPTDVLYFNNQLLLRAPPDAAYSFDISCFKVHADYTEGEDLEHDMYYRFYASGASLLWFQDKGAVDEYQAYKQIHADNKHDIDAVTARTRMRQPIRRSF